MAKKKHFRGVGKEKIHTSRDGSCESFGSCNYRDNTPAAPEVPAPRQSHHVVCVSSTIAYKGDPDYEGCVSTIDAVYKNTEWCVNQAANLKWLPLKGTYTKVKNNMGRRNREIVRLPRGEADVWSMDLPCHDWDHNCSGGYTDEVKDALADRIWSTLKDAKEDGECPEDSEVTAELQELEKDFQQKLRDRGRRQGGTKAAIGKEAAGTWWLPFSMAKATVARRRVVRAFGGGADVKGLVRGKK